MQLDVIYNEDCLEGMNRLPEHSIDCIISDLPYGITQNKWDSVIPLEQLWVQYQRVCTGAMVLTSSQPFTSTLVSSNYKRFSHEWIWHKNAPTGHLNAKRMPLKEHESVLVFGGATYNPQGIRPFGKFSGGRTNKSSNWGLVQSEKPVTEFTCYPRSVISFSVEHGPHPTQKPVALFEYLIRTYTNPGEIVLDNCMGSGTTAIACINTGRRYIGFEKDPKYFAVAQKRISDHQPPLIHKEAA